MFRSNHGGLDSSDANMTSKQQETHKEMVLDVNIDPKDPKANEAARIIQHAYRKHQENQDSCQKHQYPNIN
uniref:Ovule protein n=1 Tax=Loa loa TaxID=7209 RepID=A0A1I7VRV6_LOALO